MAAAGSGDGRDFGHDVLSLAVVRVIGVAAGFLTSVLAARLLGTAEFGVGGVAFTLATVAALVANGGLTMSTIFILRRRGDRPRPAIDALAGLGLIVVGLAAVLGVIVAVAAGRLGVPGMAGVVVLATGVVAATTVAVETAGAQLLGIGASRAYSVAEATRAVATLLACALIMLVVGTAAGYMAGLAMGMIVAAAVALTMAARRVGRPRPRVDRAVWSEAIRFGLRGQIGNVLQYFTLRLDLVLVAVIVGAVPAGIYLVATRVSEVVTQIASAAATLLFPAVAGHRDGADPAFTTSVVRTVTVLVAIAAVVIGAGSIWLVPVIFGAAYADAVPALLWLLVAAIPLSIGRVLQGDIKGRGRPGTVSVAAGLSIVVLIVGDLLVLGTLGIVGAAIVSTLAYALNAVALAIAFRSITTAPIRTLLVRPADIIGLLDSARRLGRRALG